MVFREHRGRQAARKSWIAPRYGAGTCDRGATNHYRIGLGIVMLVANLFVGVRVTTGDPASRWRAVDAKVLWVSQRQRIARINLGSADGLRPRTIFKVFAQGVNDFHNTPGKATVEVTRIVGERLAEVRILRDDVRNPVLPGDQLDVLVWNPRDKVRFAIAGLVDVTGNGKSDRELVRQLIVGSGGVIDAELQDDGTLSGKLSAKTRYLFLGQPPRDKRSLKVYERLIKEAATLGIETIDVGSLLQMGSVRDPSDRKPSPRGGRE